jgi:hypothetical protein
VTSHRVSSISSPTQRSSSALSTSRHSHNSLAFLRDLLLSPWPTSTAAVTSVSVVSLVRLATQPTALVVSLVFLLATVFQKKQYLILPLPHRTSLLPPPRPSRPRLLAMATKEPGRPPARSRRQDHPQRRHQPQRDRRLQSQPRRHRTLNPHQRSSRHGRRSPLLHL